MHYNFIDILIKKVFKPSFLPVAQNAAHSANNTKVMGSIPRENKNLSSVYLECSTSRFG